MNQKIFADLHNHTTESDGEFTPKELVEKAKSLGLKAIAVTDHDTLKGLKTAVQAGEELGMEVIPGVEISVCFKKPFFTGTLHLLGYFSSDRLYDTNWMTRMDQMLARGRGEALVRARIREINEYFGPGGKTPLLSIPMEFGDIERLSRSATRRHFALALTENFGITDRETITRILGNESPAYLPSGTKLTDIREIILDKGMFCALAHPAAGSFPGPGHYKEVLPPLDIVLRILPEFIEAGIHGLEVYYPGHTQAQQEDLKSLAKKHNLVITGGSDCHDGKDRPMGVEGLTGSEYEIFKAAFL
jgi:predicted metal-dependent phosphoesterase TrpH